MTELKFEPLDGAEQPTPPKELKFEPLEKEKRVMDKIADFVNPRYKSVLEGRNMGIPDAVDPQKNLKSALKSEDPNTINDIMHSSGRAHLMVEQGKKILAEQEAYEKAKREQLRKDAAKEEVGIGTAAKDIGLSAIKVVPQVIGTALGLGELATGWMPTGKENNPLHIADWKELHKKLQENGVSPTQVNEFLAGFQSKTLQNQRQNVRDAPDGIWEAAKTYAVNPAAMVNDLVENLPGMVISGFAGGKVANALYSRAIAEAGKAGLEGAEAAAYATNKVGGAFTKAAAVATGEGAYESSNFANMASENGADWNNYILPALASGVATTAISTVTGGLGTKFGVGDIESSFARRAMNKNLQQGAAKGFGIGQGAKNFIFEPLKESAEEALQAAPQQIAQNLALGKPWDEGVAQNVGQSAVAGLGMSGAHIAGSKALEKISSPELGTVTPFGTVTPIDRGPTNEQIDTLAKHMGVPEDKYEEFRNNVRNEIDRKKQQEYEKAQTGEPTVISPIKNSGQVQPPKFDSQVQEKLLQEGNIEEQAPVPFAKYKQMGLDLNQHILDDDGSGEFFTMNPEQQVQLKTDTNRLITRGIEPERALAIAQNRMLPELRLQQKQEGQNVTTGNVAPTAGASVPTPNGTVTTPSSPPGVAGAESNGMVPNQQNAAVPNGGTGQQPPAVVQPENNAPVPEPLPKEEFDEQVAYFREALKPFEHLEQGQMTPGQQQQFKNISAEIVRLGDNQGLSRQEIYELVYNKPQKPTLRFEPINKEAAPSSTTPNKVTQEKEQTAPAAVKEIPPRDMEKPIETTEGLVEPKDLYDANEFSDQLDPVLHAHVADSAAAVDKAQADPVKAAREERDAARAHAGNIRALFRQPDIENQITQEQLDEAEKDLANAQAKLEEVEAKTEEIKAIQKQANRQRSEGGGRKKQQLTPEQQEAKNKQKEIAKIREAAAQRARTAVANATEDLAEGHEPLTDEEMADSIDQKVHEQYKEGLINNAVLALQNIIENKLLNGTAIQNKAKSLLAEYSITKKDVQAIRDKKANAAQALVDLTVDQLTRRDDLFKGQQNYRSLINLNSRSARPNMVIGKAILDFNNNRTAGSAINTIMKHGNPIERFFANHVRGFVKGVKFVVLEQGDEIPSELQKYKKQWDDARGLFLPKSKIIFIKGSSFGVGRGNDISTVLHELMHAAGMERMHIGVKNFNGNSNLSKAVADLAAIRNRVRAVYDDMVKKGTMPASIKSMVDAVPNLLHDDVVGKTEAERIELLTEALDEFLAYSLSQPEMQALLMMIPSDPKHFFENAMSRFVRDFMNLLSIPTDRFSAFTDVVLVTDRILNSRYSKSEINHVLDYRSAMGASKNVRMDLTLLRARLSGANTNEEQIAYLENEKKILDDELAKGDEGKYGKDWAQSRNGFYGFNKGKAREESALIRSDYVKDTKAHYDDVIAHLRKETPRSAKANKADEKITRGLTAAKISKLGPQLNNNVKSLQEERDPRNFAEQAGSIVSRPIKNLIAFTWDVDALGRNGKDLGLPALQTVYENMQLMSGTTSKKLIAVAKEVKALQNFYWDHPEQKENFEKLVNASTFDRYDPSNPQGKYNPTYDNMYKELGAAGQEMYKRLKDFYRDLNDEKQQLLKEQIDKLDLLPEERKKVAAALRESYESGDKIDPYFPLMRFGNFVLELGKGERKISYRFESEYQRDRAAAILANRVKKSIDQLEQDGDLLRKEDLNGNQMRGDIMNTSKMLKAINEAVNNTPNLSNLKSRNEVMDRIYQTYISFMPEASVRKQFMHRLDIPGFSDDLLRVLSAVGARSATQIARLQHGQDLRNSLKVAENQLIGNPGATPYYNKMAGYVDRVLSPPIMSSEMKVLDTASSWAAAATHFHNMTSFASALIQPVDIFARAYPIMGAQLGYSNVGAEMMRMMKITSKYGTIENRGQPNERWVMPSVSHAKGLTPDERYFLKVMDDSDVVRKTMTSVAYEGARGRRITWSPVRKFLDSKTLDRAKPVINKLVMGGLMGDMERLSREFSYMAAANAAMKNLNAKFPKMDATEKRNMAAKQAVDLTFQSFGNYAAYNKPGFFRHPLTRAILIFKFYPYVMYKTLLGNLYKSIPLLNKEGKAAAIKTVMGITGIHFLLGGVNAMPGFSLAMSAAGLMFKAFGKDPDAPDDMRDIDFETWFRTVYLPKYLGPVGLDRFVEYGLLGASGSNRISINNMLSFGDKPNETIFQSALEAFGAIPNMVKNYYDGAHALANGDYEKGFEKIAPGSISSLIAANDILNTGLRTSNGDQIEGYEAGKVSAATIAGQALGFRPSEVINQQTKDFKISNQDRLIQMERSQLTKELKDHLVKSFDLEKGADYTERHDKMFEEVLDKMVNFGQRHPELAFDRPEDPEEINNMLETALKDKYERESNAGVKLTEQNIRRAGESVDYMKEQQKKNSP
jgi:hypothetical protein